MAPATSEGEAPAAAAEKSKATRKKRAAKAKAEVESPDGAAAEPAESAEGAEVAPAPAKAKKSAKKSKAAVDPLDPEFIAAHAAKALDFEAPVFLCPVRHHSFCLSLHLPRLIAAYKPDLIAVEMPSVFKDEVPSLANESVKPPVAFFSFVTKKKPASKTTKSTKAAAAGEGDAPESEGESEGSVRSYLYPLLSFSPEYVALTEALRQGIDYELIDLTSFDEDSFTYFSEDSTFYDDDHVMARSSFFHELCEKSGAHSFAEFWNKHFEINALTQDTMSYLQQLYQYCYMVRQGIDEEREPFMVQRELFMLKNLQAAMKTHKRILVVTGGLHSVALCDYLYYKKKKATAVRFPKVPSETYLIPYSYVGSDKQTGYGAGIVFPYYFQLLYLLIKNFVPFAATEKDAPVLSGEELISNALFFLRPYMGGDAFEEQSEQKIDGDKQEKTPRDALGRKIDLQAIAGIDGNKQESKSLLLQLAQEEQESFGAKKPTKGNTASSTTVAAGATASTSADAATVSDGNADGEAVAVTAEPVELSHEEKLELLRYPVNAQAISELAFVLNMRFVNKLRNYKKQAFSTADKISCELMLRGLAELRQLLVPSVFELIDAVKSAFIKEEMQDKHYLLDQLMLRLSSVRMGRVPLNVRMPPIWRDFLAQAKLYGISLKDNQPHQIRIDINKNDKSLQKSRFINRVCFLSPAFCPESLNREGNHTFNYIKRTETYVYRYDDMVVMQIMGASVHGEDLLHACRAILVEHCKRQGLSVGEICSLYRQCVNMGIEDQYYKVQALLNQAIANERQLTAIADALRELNSYDFVAKSTDENKLILQELTDDLIKRGCAILLQQNDVVEDELDNFVQAIEELNYYAIKEEKTRTLYFGTLEELVDDAEISAALQGAYLALLYKNRRLRYETLVHYVNQFVLGSVTSDRSTIGFFYTLILISRGNLFNRDSILSLLNAYLQNLAGDEFLKVLVLLRRVFVNFNSFELHKLVRMLKRILGLNPLEFTYQVDPEEYMRNRKIDQELAQDLKKWHLEEKPVLQTNLTHNNQATALSGNLPNFALDQALFFTAPAAASAQVVAAAAAADAAAAAGSPAPAAAEAAGSAEAEAGATLSDAALDEVFPENEQE